MKDNMKINEYAVISQCHWKDLVHSECSVGIKTHYIVQWYYTSKRDKILILKELTV